MEDMKGSTLFGIGSFLLLSLIVGMVGCPQYNVYHERLSGEAELAKATYNRQIKVREAEAIKEAAVDLAEAEVTRAGGVARANNIIGTSLKNNEAYLRWLYIEGLKDNKNNQIVYIPTEAGLPILEAERLHGK